MTLLTFNHNRPAGLDRVLAQLNTGLVRLARRHPTSIVVIARFVAEKLERDSTPITPSQLSLTPSESTLVTQFRVSPPSVQRAILHFLAESEGA